MTFKESTSAERQVSEVLLAATQPMVAIAARALAAQEDQITIVQYSALVALASSEPSNLSTLADSLGVHASTATRMCDRLVSRNLIERVRSRDSRREVQLSLSARGRELVASETARRRVEIDRIVQAIPEDQREAVANGLRVFLDASTSVGTLRPESPVAEPTSST